MAEFPENVSYEQLLTVKYDIDELVPGYYIQELDPVRALESGQGNCYTKNVLAAAVLAVEQGFDSSISWPDRRHALPPAINSITGKPRTIEDSMSSKMTALEIAHTALVVPRGGDEYDILQLVYGMHTIPGKVFQLEEVGQISDYNFDQRSPRDTDVSTPADRADEAMLEVKGEGIVVPTEYGASMGIVSGDWQEMADEYLARLDLPPNNYDELETKVAAYLAALRDGRPRPHLRIV